MLTLSSCTGLRDADETRASTGGAGRPTQTDSPVVTVPTNATENTPDTKAQTDGTDTSSATPTPTPGELNFPTDFSFLDTVQKGNFSDTAADDPNGTWYPGKTTRDLVTGEVTYNWDRAADVFECMDKYNGIYRGSDAQKVIYLTFDCGYEYRPADGSYPNGVTDDILNTLKEKNAPGTFFVTGDYIKSEPGLVKRMLDEGHIVGTHTMHHYNMTTLTPEEFVAEIKDNNDLLKETVPTAPDMVFYRPPEGGANEWTMALACRMGLTTVFWSAIQPMDHDVNGQLDPETVLYNDEVKLHNGCVYLLHAVSTTNAKILGDLIDYARGEGYEIRALSEFVR